MQDRPKPDVPCNDDDFIRGAWDVIRIHYEPGDGSKQLVYPSETEVATEVSSRGRSRGSTNCSINLRQSHGLELNTLYLHCDQRDQDRDPCLSFCSLAWPTSLLERKVVGHMQNRWGPSRVRPIRIAATVVDGLKFLLKEDLTPPHVNKPLYIAAPMYRGHAALTSISVIPFGESFTLARPSDPTADHRREHRPADHPRCDLDLRCTGPRLSGWSSNSKYSLLGSLRASAQMVSYEIGAWALADRCDYHVRQPEPARHCERAIGDTSSDSYPTGRSFVGQIVAFFIYLCAALCGNQPYPFRSARGGNGTGGRISHGIQRDEVRDVLHGGIREHVTVACIASLLFLGGWHGPVFGSANGCGVILPVVWFALRVFGFIFLYIWIRGTLPRFRYDQFMAFGWKFLFPISSGECT